MYLTHTGEDYVQTPHVGVKAFANDIVHAAKNTVGRDQKVLFFASKAAQATHRQNRQYYINQLINVTSHVSVNLFSHHVTLILILSLSIYLSIIYLVST